MPKRQPVTTTSTVVATQSLTIELVTLRETRGVSKQDIARKMGVQVETVNNIEQGVIRTIPMLERYAKACDDAYREKQYQK